MEFLYHFKIKCILQTVLKPRLIKLFKKRWILLNGVNYESNSINGSNLILENSNLNLKLLERINLQKGFIHKLPIELLLKLLLFNNNSSSKEIIKQNKVIEPINEFVKVFILPKEQESYNSLKKEIKHLLKLLDEYLNEGDGMREELSIGNEIKNKLNSIQKDKNEINNENELKAKEIKERGNKEFLKKNYLLAKGAYISALELDGISIETMGILYLNLSTTCFDYCIEKTSNHNVFMMDNEDLENLQEATVNAREAITYRPNWGKAYFRLGKCYSKQSAYLMSISMFKAAHYLASQENDKSIQINEMIKLIIQDQVKLNTRTESVYRDGDIDDPESFKRDFKQEAINKVLAYGEIKKSFGNLKIDSKFLGSVLTKEEEGFIKVLEFKLGFSLKTSQEKYISLIAEGLQESGNDDYDEDEENIKKREYSYLSRCIGNETTIASCYFKLAEMYRNQEIVKYNGKMITSLLLQGTVLCPTTMGISQEILDSDPTAKQFNENNDILYLHYELGRIYKTGLYGEDYDLEKSIYHLNFVVDNYESLMGSKKNDDVANAYYLLGMLYFTGPKFIGSVEKDKEKTKQLWRKGCEMVEKPLGLKDALELKHLNIGADLGNSDLNDSKIPINHSFLTQILGTDISSNSPTYTKQVLSIYKLQNQFIDSFNRFKQLSNQQQSNVSFNEKIEIIKPLVEIYKQFELYSVLRIPREMIDSIRNFIDQLLEIDIGNLQVRIIYLGINRLDGKENEKLLFSIESLKYCNDVDGADGTYDSLIFKYYHCVFLNYLGQFDNLFLNSLKYSNEFKNGNNKDIFNYYLLRSIGYCDLDKLLFSTQPTQPSIDKEEVIESIIKNTNNSISRLPIDSPLVTESYFNLSLLLSKSQSTTTFSSGINRITNDQILEYYNKGLECYKLLLSNFWSNNHRVNNAKELVEQSLINKNIIQ